MYKYFLILSIITNYVFSKNNSGFISIFKNMNSFSLLKNVFQVSFLNGLSNNDNYREDIPIQNNIREEKPKENKKSNKLSSEYIHTTNLDSDNAYLKNIHSENINSESIVNNNLSSTNIMSKKINTIDLKGINVEGTNGIFKNLSTFFPISGVEMI
jgi:hypothetical protein